MADAIYFVVTVGVAVVVIMVGVLSAVIGFHSLNEPFVVALSVVLEPLQIATSDPALIKQFTGNML